MTVGNKVTAYKYNKNDELLRTDTLNTDTERDSVVLYKYDKNGNQLATVNRYEIPSEKKDGAYIDIDVTLGDNRLNENVVNHYNAENQLIQTLTKNYKVSFTYDAEGLRTGKTVNGKKTTFVWDGDQLVMELDASGKVQKRYIRGNDRGYGSNLVYADKGDNTEKQYYVTDPHGNVVQLADESGRVIKTYEYDSFGNEVNQDSKDENPFRYCGEYYDKETEEIYLRARYYKTEVGRFLTRDTYTGEEDEPESLHLYAYCGNDGVNAWNPSGHKNIYDTDAGDRKIIRREIKKLTKLKKKDRKKFFKPILKNRKNWKKKWKFTTHLTTDLQNKKTSQLLAWMLFGECSSGTYKKKKGKPIPYQNRMEMLALWQIVSNSSKNLHHSIKEELLRINRYESLTGDDYNRTIALRPEYNINWARAVIIATMYQKQKISKLKKAPGITKKMQYFYEKNTFYAAYNSKKKTIKWTDGTTDKVGKKKQYATTVFFEIKMGG